MFRGLASYFLGGDGHPVMAPEATCMGAPTYKTTEDEDDWVLVDVTNNALNKSQQEDDDAPSQHEEKPPANDHHHLPPLSLSPEDSSSTPEVSPPSSPSQMEGSWYVTPPACFTAAGGPVQLATSPLENLLIEHPSMSVYASTGLSSYCMSQSIVPSASTVIVDTQMTARHYIQQAPVPPPASTSSPTPINELPQDDPPVENEEPPRRRISRSRRRRSVARDQSTETRRRPPRRTASLAARASLIEAMEQGSVATNGVQKVQPQHQQRGQQTLKRSYLDRQNRVYGFQNSTRHMRRKDRMIRPSGANNNRKCC